MFEKAKESPDLFAQDLNFLLCALKELSINGKISLNDIITAHKEYENELVWSSPGYSP